MGRPEITKRAALDMTEIGKLLVRANRRRALGYTDVPIPTDFLLQLCDLAAKALTK
jgi:hypothetical protein